MLCKLWTTKKNLFLNFLCHSTKFCLCLHTQQCLKLRYSQFYIDMKSCHMQFHQANSLRQRKAPNCLFHLNKLLLFVKKLLKSRHQNFLQKKNLLFYLLTKFGLLFHCQIDSKLPKNLCLVQKFRWSAKPEPKQNHLCFED